MIDNDTRDVYSNCILTDVELFTENYEYFLRLKYKYEDDRSVKEIYIPKLWLGIDPKNISITHHLESLSHSADIGFGPMPLEYAEVPGYSKNHREFAFVVKTLAEKVPEMTVSDIEKKLGYKIKIVAEKEN